MLSEDAAVNGKGLLDIVLRWEDGGGDKVPVRQIQEQTSLRLVLLEELLKEWANVGSDLP